MITTEKFDNDIKLIYVTAKSFPDGILEAHQKLHSVVAFSPERKYFGLSRPENGTIVYHATTEQIDKNEAEDLNCDALILKKGKYISTTIHDYMKDIQSIGRTFEQLLTQPGLDPEGYCVEWYISDKDVKCMIRLEE